MSRAPLIGRAEPPDLHVMTFNVRRRINRVWGRSADRWSTRRPAVQELLRTERPALLGVQEALPDQAQVIAGALGDGYRFAGRGGQAGGRGEGCPIFFDTERLELFEWEQTALSSRPHEPGSRTWGNLIPRILVRAAFRDKATGARFVALNAHLDPFSPASRVHAAAEIRRRAMQPLPAVVTGDLNARPGSPALRELCSDDVLTDAWTRASERLTPAWKTFASYRTPRVARTPGGESGDARIDWIAVSPDVTVSRVAINARRFDGRWPSDHLPVQAVVRIPQGDAR